jgi:glutaredoxin
VNRHEQAGKVTILGRRNCVDCKHWRYVALDFLPKKDGDKYYIPHTCVFCRREKDKAKYRKFSQEVLEKRNKSSRTWYRRNRRQQRKREYGPRVLADKKHEGVVERLPLAQWLLRVKEDRGDNWRQLSEYTGISQRYIHSIINGYMVSKGKLRPVDWVGIGIVDRIALRIGNPRLLDELYPLEHQDS